MCRPVLCPGFCPAICLPWLRYCSNGKLLLGSIWLRNLRGLRNLRWLRWLSELIGLKLLL